MKRIIRVIAASALPVLLFGLCWLISYGLDHIFRNEVENWVIPVSWVIFALIAGTMVFLAIGCRFAIQFLVEGIKGGRIITTVIAIICAILLLMSPIATMPMITIIQWFAVFGFSALVLMILGFLVF